MLLTYHDSLNYKSSYNTEEIHQFFTGEENVSLFIKTNERKSNKHITSEVLHRISKCEVKMLPIITDIASVNTLKNKSLLQRNYKTAAINTTRMSN